MNRLFIKLLSRDTIYFEDEFCSIKYSKEYFKITYYTELLILSIDTIYFWR